MKNFYTLVQVHYCPKSYLWKYSCKIKLNFCSTLEEYHCIAQDIHYFKMHILHNISK
jgi:hypothetical protein